MIEDGKLAEAVDKRYAKWEEPQNKAMLAGKESLDYDRRAGAEVGARPAAQIRPAGISEIC